MDWKLLLNLSFKDFGTQVNHHSIGGWISCVNQPCVRRIQGATKVLATQKNLRRRDCTSDEEYFSQERHRLVIEEDWGLKARNKAERNWFGGWEGE